MTLRNKRLLPLTEPDDLHRLSRIIFIIAALVFIIWGVSQAQSVLVSFLVSAFLSVLATPPVLWLQKKRVPVIIAVFIVVAGMVLFLIGTGTIVGTSINSFYEALPEYQKLILAKVNSFEKFLTQKGMATPQKVLLKYVNPEAIMTLTAKLFTRLGSAFSDIVLIILTVTFILLEVTSFPLKLQTILGNPKQVFPKFTLFVNDMKRYMVIKTLMCLATGILVTILLYILDVDFPILWGFLAFLLNYVPTIGSTIAGIPAVLLALIQKGIWMAVIAAAGYIVINFVVDYGIEKRLMGSKLGLSTLIVFLSLLFWEGLIGPIGAVLCIPLTMTLKFAFESNEQTQWIAVLLGPEKYPEKAEKNKKPF
ncbi:MAG TPA: AI-2E family transporter [bacterium]|nr:AI-2E family transporter [bacterium]